MLSLGVLPIKAMLAVEEHVWVSCGGHVFIISTHTHSVEVCPLSAALPFALPSPVGVTTPPPPVHVDVCVLKVSVG